MNPSPKTPVATLPTPIRASLEDERKVVILFADPPTYTPAAGQFRFDPDLPIVRVTREGRRRVALFGGPFDMRFQLHVHVEGLHNLPVLPEGILNRYKTNEPLGLTWNEKTATVRLFHPRARSVRLVVHDDPALHPVDELAMTLDDHTGCWRLDSDAIKAGQTYGFRVEGPDDVDDQRDIVFCDPYSWQVAKAPGWPVKMLSVVPDPSWRDLPQMSHVSIPPRDLMIYEAHLKDVTMKARNVEEPLRGTYRGVSSGSFPGYVRDLGFNAVEWLPLHVYDDREPPYGTPGNAWNETAMNHWGYMSVQFFAPEPRYRHPVTLTRWNGTDPAIIHDVRGMVDSLHQRGLAVILDVVYNHVGNYGLSPLRRLDPMYWLRHDGYGQLKSDSGCGNDFATERPMAQRMIVDSLLHWTNVYGFDGFRFDLAGLIDDSTLNVISERVRQANPNVHLIAEPWGGLYDKRRFAVRGWSAWNDKFRDGLRGHDAVNQHGAILHGDADTLMIYTRGHVTHDGGPFDDEWQSVNYLASHDYYNLGDFLRIATGLVKPDSVLTRDEAAKLSPNLLRRAFLGYFFLFTSRGMLMLHQGDEWLRAKIVADNPHVPKSLPATPRKQSGQLDRDSYNRDDDTNWIDWTEAELEPFATIRDYVRGLAQLRRTHPALRVARYSNLHRLPGHGGPVLAYVVRVPGDRLVFMLNLSDSKPADVTLPDGAWIKLADEQTVLADPKRGRAYTGTETLPPLSARLFQPRQNHQTH